MLRKKWYYGKKFPYMRTLKDNDVMIIKRLREKKPNYYQSLETIGLSHRHMITHGNKFNMNFFLWRDKNVWLKNILYPPIRKLSFVVLGGIKQRVNYDNVYFLIACNSIHIKVKRNRALIIHETNKQPIELTYDQ